MLPCAGAALLLGELTLRDVGGSVAEDDVVAAKGGIGAGTLARVAVEVESGSAAKAMGAVAGLSLVSGVWRGAGFGFAPACVVVTISAGALVLAATFSAAGADCQFRIWSGVIRSTTTSALPGPSIPSL